MKTHQFLVRRWQQCRARCTQRQHQPPTRRPVRQRERAPAVLYPQHPFRTEAAAVVAFWREAGPGLWFAKDSAFDRSFRERFLSLHEAAARGELDGWLATPDGALALVLLLDQFPRNAFRGTPRMYATDASARRVAVAAIDAGHDRGVNGQLQLFFYLPFGHSENLADQERSVALAERLGEPSLSHAEAASRHHPPLRPLPASQPDSRAHDEAGGAAVSRYRRIRRLMSARAGSLATARADAIAIEAGKATALLEHALDGVPDAAHAGGCACRDVLGGIGDVVGDR